MSQSPEELSPLLEGMTVDACGNLYVVEMAASRGGSRPYHNQSPRHPLAVGLCRDLGFADNATLRCSAN